MIVHQILLLLERVCVITFLFCDFFIYNVRIVFVVVAVVVVVVFIYIPYVCNSTHKNGSSISVETFRHCFNTKIILIGFEI